jgi:hypothetical protein
VLRHHAGLHHQHQEEDQKCALVVARETEQQQGRHVAHAVDAHHDAPLQLGIALQKALRVIGQGAGHRNRQKHIDRNEHREQVEMAAAHQPVLDGSTTKKASTRLR